MRHAAHPRLITALTVALLFSLSLVAQAVPPAHSADASLVFAAYQAIMTHHIQRQEPIKLLTGALNGLRQALAKAGITERLTDLTSADETIAKSEFQAQFDRAVSLAQGKLTVTQLQYAAANAMSASVGDSWTEFNFPGQNAVNVTGIGIWSRYKFGRLVVVSIVPYSPAASAGLHPFDRILAIDGQSVQVMMSKGLRWRDIRIIPGPEGSTAKLIISRPGQNAPLTVSIVRQRITRIPGVVHKKLDGGLGYIWVRSLGVQNDWAEFRRALVDLQRGGMRGLILDLRVPSGVQGYNQGLQVANTLLPAGVPVQTIVSHLKDLGTHTRREACPTLIRGRPWRFAGAEIVPLPSPCAMTTEGGTLLDHSTPLVVLIDETTHHIGETLSAAIRDTRRGKLLGVRTAGQTAVGPELDLPGGTAIDVQSYIVLAGNGTVLDKVGVQPDVVVELTAADLDRGVDTQLQRAVEMLSR